MIRLFLNAGVYAGSGALLRLCGFVIFLWLARSLPIKEYATWGLLYALQTAVTSFGAVGIVESVIGLLKSNRAEGERERLFAAANGVFVVVVTLAVILVMVLFYALNGVGNVAGLTILSVFGSGALLAYASFQAQIVRLEERHFASLYFNFGVPLLGFVGGGLAFAMVGSVLAYFAGAAAGLAVPLVLAPFFRCGFYSVTASMFAWRPLFLRISPFVVVTFFGWLGGYGTSYLIKLFFVSEEVAKFTFLFNLAAVMQLVATSIQQVWNPRFYRMIHEIGIDEAERRNLTFFNIGGLGLGATGAVLIFLYPIALHFLGGNLSHYVSLRPELFLLVVAYIALVPNWHGQNYLLAFDKGATLMNVHVLTGIAGTILLLVFMWQFGPLGVYIGFVAQMTLRSVGLYFAARKYWSVGIAWHGMVGGILISFVGLLVSEIVVPH